MKEWFENLYCALTWAWERQIDLPLPERLRGMSDPDRGGAWRLAAFPLLGWLIGVIAAAPGCAAELLFNRFTGAVLFALAGFLVLTFRDSGRSDGVVSGMLADLLPGKDLPMRLIVPTLLMFVRFALLMLLFMQGNASQLPLTLAGIFAMETLLTLDGGFVPPLLEDDPAARRRFWIVVILVTLGSFLCGRLATALGAAGFAVAWRVFQRKSERDGTDLAQITLAGSITGWILLLAGLLSV